MMFLQVARNVKNIVKNCFTVIRCGSKKAPGLIASLAGKIKVAV